MSENYLASVIYFVKSCPYIIPNVYSSVQSQRNQHLLKIKVRFIRAPDAASRIGRSNIKHQSRQIYFNEQRWLFNGVVTTNKAICMYSRYSCSFYLSQTARLLFCTLAINYLSRNSALTREPGSLSFMYPLLSVMSC